MAAKLILSTVAITALLSSAAFAQVQTTETDPRFMPRIYGSTAITGVDYGQGATTTQSTSITVETQPVVTYNQGSNVVRVVEPITPDVQTAVSAPVTYNEAGVVRAQHFKQGDLSNAEYQALLEEADRIRAYQVTNENYTGVSYGAAKETAQSVQAQAPYQIELFAQPEVNTAAAPTNSTVHTVIKGDTLYYISKRYAVTIDALQNANKITDNNIGLGQVLTIPSSTTVVSENTYVEPVTLVSTAAKAPVTLVRNVEPVPGQNSGVYAVLPKDTLYSISRRACVKVGDLISVNGITDPSTLQPGQRLTMPTGHCLN